MDLEEVEKLIVLMQHYDLSELQLKDDKVEFLARRGEKPQPIIVTQPAIASQAMMQAVPSPSASGSLPPVEKPKNVKHITSLLVGTFYRQPAPDQPPFKEVGDRVSPDDVVCIVEAMKVMNEIKAGMSGIIRKIMVENATAVEYGQPIFEVEVG